MYLGWISVGRHFLGEVSFRGGGVNFPGERLHWGDLTELLYKILFNCLKFPLPNFTCGNVLGKITGVYFRRVFISVRQFPWKGAFLE